MYENTVGNAIYVNYLNEDAELRQIIFSKKGKGAVEYFRGGTRDLLVETQGNWTLSFEPLTPVGAIDFAGSGCDVTGIFTVSGMTMLEVTQTRRGYDICTINLYSRVGDTWDLSDIWFLEDSGMDNTTTKKLILKITEPTDCFITVDVDKGDWSIKAVR